MTDFSGKSYQVGSQIKLIFSVYIIYCESNEGLLVYDDENGKHMMLDGFQTEDFQEAVRIFNLCKAYYDSVEEYVKPKDFDADKHTDRQEVCLTLMIEVYEDEDDFKEKDVAKEYFCDERYYYQGKL